MINKIYPKISVIIPVYKVEEFIHECIDSIASQDYENLEILLIDDGSPDKCPEICDEYATKDSRIKVFHTENLGQGPARNVGLDNATGEYITFIDSDDSINQGYFSYFYKVLNSDIKSDTFIFKVNNEKSDIIWRTYNQETFIKEAFSEFVAREGARFGLMNCAWRLICKKSIIDNIKFYNIFMEDKPFFLEILLKSQQIALIPKEYYNYRINPESLSNRYVNNLAESSIFVMNYQYQLLKRYNVFKIYPQIIKYHRYAILRYYLTLIKNESKLSESTEENLSLISKYYRDMEVDNILTLRLAIKLSLKNVVWLFLKFNKIDYIIEKYRKKKNKKKNKKKIR